MARKLKKELQIAYCAGILDADGHLGMRMRKNCIDFTVQIQMTDIEPILLFQELYGGNITKYQPKTKNSKEFYRWGVWSNKAIHILEDCFPYFTIKRKKAELAIKLLRLGRFNRKTLTQDVINRRREIVDEYKLLDSHRKYNRWGGV